MITLECFGGVVARDNTDRPCALRSRKHLGLLTYVAANPHTLQTRETLAELLWNGVGPRERHSLSQALYDLRSHVGPVLAVTARTVALRPGAIVFDGTVFEKAVEAGDHLTALEIYKGAFATNLTALGADTFDRWLDRERERFRVLASIAFRNVLRNAEERGDWDCMCLAALRVIRENEFDETAHAALMRGLWLMGDPASALAHFEVVCQTSTAETWQSLRQLATRILASGAASELLSLPRRPIQLIGRERQFKDLSDLLTTPRSCGNVALISGERGVGKTALLTEFARLAEVHGRQLVWLNQGAQHGSRSHLDKDIGRSSSRDVVYLLDSGASDPPCLDDLHALSRSRNAVTVATIPAGAAAQNAIAPHGTRLIHLPPLSTVQTRALIAGRFPECPAHAIRAAGHLCGGNPRLAIEICRAWENAGTWPTEGGSEELAIQLLARRNALAILIEEWYSALSKTELDVVALLAFATPPARRVIRCYVDSEMGPEALESLEGRGWVVVRGKEVSLAHEIVRHALRLRPPSRPAKEYHRRLGRALERGGARERLASAVEYEQGGESATAQRVAAALANEALGQGDVDIATAASSVAYRTAASIQERFEAGVLLAESELARGCARRAASVLRTLQGVAPTPTGELGVTLKLGRAVVAEGLLDEGARLLEQVAHNVTRLEPSLASAILRLQAAQLRLDLAMRRHDVTSPIVVSDMETQLAQLRPAAPACPVAWSDGVRLLFGYHLARRSRAAAQRSIDTYSDTLARLRDIGPAVLATCRAALELKAGRLYTARQILCALVEEREETRDRLHSVALNNLAVTLLESGEFDGARAQLDATTTIDEAVGLPGSDRVTTDMNRAQCAFFAGSHAAARTHLERVIITTRAQGLLALEAQALAMIGLMRLAQGGANAGAQATEVRSLLPRVPLDPDSYLVDWFLVAERIARGQTVAGAELTDAAAVYEPLDCLAAAKLRVVASGLQETDASDKRARESRQVLRASGCGWFVAFASAATRWQRRCRAGRP